MGKKNGFLWRGLGAIALMLGCTAVGATAQTIDLSGFLDNASFELSVNGSIRQGATNTGYGSDVQNWQFYGAGDNASGQNGRDSFAHSYTAGTGNNLVGFFNHNRAGDVMTAITNVRTIAYTPGYTVSMTVALGNVNINHDDVSHGAGSYDDPGNYQLAFYTQQQNTPLAVSAPIIGANIPEGTLQDFTFSWTIPLTYVPDPNNNAVRLAIIATSTANGQQSSFDDVRLSAITPEPSSLALLGLGGLLIRRRRA